MATKLADAFVRLYADSGDLDRGLSDAQGKVGAFGNVAQGILQGVGQAITNGIVNVTRAAFNEIKDGIGKASDLNETISKTRATFGSSANEILKWSETTSSSLGLSQRAALDATGGLGNMFIQLGAGRQKASELSREMIGLSADIASYANVAGGAEEVSQAMSSAFRGEYDSLQRYIPTINAAAVEQRALTMTGKDNAKQLSLLDKAYAVHELIITGAGAATGDFNRTQLEAANGSRILAAKMEEGAASLGSSFLPAVASIQNLLIGLAPKMFEYAKNITDQLANGLAAGITALLPVIFTIRQLFEYWFKPGSPPRILPDIDKWGAAAMGQFLKGFSSVDVKSAFAGIGSAIENILRSDVSAGKADDFGLVGRVFGTRDAIVKAVAEFAKAGNVSESTINKIARSAGSAGPSIGALVKSYFDLQKATTAATRAQDNLNRITEKYDAILNPLRNSLDDVRGQQQALANQQRLIDAQNTLNNFESTDAEKRAAQLEIQQIALENQISTTEQQKKAETDKAQAQLDGATKAETAAQKQFDIAQATIDQQVETNNLLGEQKRLVEQLAATQEAAAKKAESEAEQAANKSKAEAEKAQRALEQIADAQLRYRMQVADTAGDIAIVEEELSKLTPGTAEYYDKLTQLDALHKQYNAELEAAAKKTAALAGIDIGPGLDTGVLQPLEDAGKGMDSLAAAIEKAGAPLGPVSENMKSLGESIKALVTVMGSMLGIDVAPFFTKTKESTQIGVNAYGDFGVAAFAAAVKAGEAAKKQKADAEATAIAMKKSVDDTTLTMRTLQSDYNVIMDLLTGDWHQFWIDWAENQRLSQEANNNDSNAKFKQWKENVSGWLNGIKDNINQWIIDQLKALGQFFVDIGAIILKGGGDAVVAFAKWNADVFESTNQWFADLGKAWSDGAAGLVDFFVEGLSENWHKATDWFTGSLQGLKDLLPGSEPKDPSSPLRGLKKSGAALVDMFQSGMDAASLNINPLANSLLAPAGAATTTNTSSAVHFGPGSIAITIAGNANADDVRKGVNNGVLDALRASGVAI